MLGTGVWIIVASVGILRTITGANKLETLEGFVLAYVGLHQLMYH